MWVKLPSLIPKNTYFVYIFMHSNRDVMKYLLKSMLVLALSVLSMASFAAEFSHFSLKGQLKELNTESSDGLFKTQSINVQTKKQIQNQLNSRLLKLNSDASKSVIEDESPPLIKKIVNLLAGNYNQIGNEQTNPLVLNHDIGGGVLNFSGFTWNKPTANFQLYANRELAPDLFSSRWIVHDTFVIGIDATTFLSNLKDDDLIDISQDAIGAFAGVSFQRVYHYYHYADTYLKGLTSDYSKLFLSFTKFSTDHIINLDPYEILKKEDQFSFNAGGVVTTPPVYGVSGSAGVLVSAAFENKLTIQALGPDDQKKNNEFLRISVDKKWDVSADAHLSVQLDFFNLLKLTILSYDLEYSYGKSHKQNLSFYENDIELIHTSSEHHKEFKQIVKGTKEDIQVWKNNIVQLEDRVTENLNSKYSILLLGKIRKTETEQIRVIKDGVEKVFYKHYSQSIKYVQNLLSKLFNIVVYKLFDFQTGVKNFAESIKKMKVEYQHTEDFKAETVSSESEFSISLTQEFSAGKTHRWIDKKLKSEAVHHINAWSNLEESIARKVASEELRGPLRLESQIEIEKAGLNYFHTLNEDDIFSLIIDVCHSRRKNKWLNKSYRNRMLKRVQVGRSACVKKIGNRYLDYAHNLKEIGYYDLNKLRKFLGQYFSKVSEISQIENLFGQDNIFVHGSLNAMTNENIPFSTYFKSGNFRGLGVIDTYMRQSGTTTPVKIMK